jgi:hypothetical protein
MKMTEKFGRINFADEDGYNCCGQMVIFNIEEGRTDKPKWSTAATWPLFDSRVEQAKDFIDRIQGRLEEITRNWNDGVHEDEEVDCCFGFMTMTLIKGPKPQIPGLVEYLLHHGWQCDQEVVNPKTKNTIVHLSKAL